MIKENSPNTDCVKIYYRRKEPVQLRYELSIIEPATPAGALDVGSTVGGVIL